MLVKVGAKICAVFLCTLALSHAARTETCFKNDEKPAFEIFQQAPPPKDDSREGYPFYPATSFASMNIDALAHSHSKMSKYCWQWANHGPRRVPKGNLGPGVLSQASPTKIFFSSPEKANACTLAQTAAVLGFDELVQDYARRGNLSTITSPPPSNVEDICIVSTTRLPPDCKGILLDYEVADGRLPPQTLEFLLEFAELVHRAKKQAILYTNPLDAPTQSLTAIDGSNAARLMDAYDKMSIFLWSKSRQNDIRKSFESQLNVLGRITPEKLFVIFELNNTTIQDASAVRSFVMEHGLAGVSLWRNFAVQGGACSTDVNRKIACIAYGRCNS